ncbi:hypothetical protein ND00_19950 [Clostridium sp. L74]|nr:hypothetical protein ND00_19950 [Clostridium sp. L74]
MINFLMEINTFFKATNHVCSENNYNLIYHIDYYIDYSK